MKIMHSDWKIKFIPLGYRLIALILASVLVVAFKSSYFPVGPGILIGVALLECLIASIPPFFIPRWHSQSAGLMLSTLSCLLCLLLVWLSQSIESPFILYALSPIISAALFLDQKKTVLVACGMIIAVLLADLFDPFNSFRANPEAISQIIFFTAAACLIAVLPHVVNINLRRNLTRDNILEERQRLSHEIHDGVAQTLHALCWQVQQIRQNRNAMNVKSEDLEQLENLAEKARADILEALEVLRNSESGKNLKDLFEECLEQFKTATGIDYTLKVETDQLNPAEEIKKELLSIFMEALANIKKHSGAQRVSVVLKKENGYMVLNVTDDGRGFDAVSHFTRLNEHCGHYGLAVMQERTQSIDGKFKIQSQPSLGTVVEVEIPLYRFNARY